MYAIRSYYAKGAAPAATRAAAVAAAPQRTFSMVQTARYPVLSRFNAGTGDIRTPAHAAKDTQRGTYLVLFSDAPLGAYHGEVAGLAAPQAKIGVLGRQRIDVKSQASLEFV